MGTTAIILAAGKGTRMSSDEPKVLHEVCGRYMLAYVMDACRGAGADRLLVVVGYQAGRVQEALTGNDHDVTWVLQDPQLGTGHAVMVCREQLAEADGPVLVLAGDGPLVRSETLRELLETHAREGAACTLATSILPDPGRYGRVVRDENGEVTGVVEYLDADEDQRRINEVNVSLYCFDSGTLPYVLEKLSNDNAKGEYYLTDAVAILRRGGYKLAAVPAARPEDVLSVNTDEELQRVEKIMKTRDVGEARP
ncbi:MAG: NTP transferase domain-containing protein [Phycisphaerae bacterium]